MGWRFNAKEVAQWAPSFLDLVDQKPLRRDSLLDLIVVPLEGLYGVLRFLKPPAMRLGRVLKWAATTGLDKEKAVSTTPTVRSVAVL